MTTPPVAHTADSPRTTGSLGEPGPARLTDPARTSDAAPAPRPFDPAAIVADLLAEPHVTADRWHLTDGALWLGVFPADGDIPAQGWKLHLSATPVSAATVLERAARTLLRRGVGFKVAASPARVQELVSRRYDRASAGKFLTAYPQEGVDLPALAAELHAATEGLAGPQILSDRPYRPGSLVQYRWGGFRRTVELADNGVYRPVITDAAGARVADVREPWYTPPRGIPDPFDTASETGSTGAAADTAGSGGARPAPRAVVLADRFVISGALRLSTKGGVFRATDRLTGEQVIVKQGRAHIDATRLGTDVRDLLRNEARMLDVLAPLGLTPRAVALVPEDGHLFLVQEQLEGVPLRLWNLRARAGGDRPGRRAVADLAGRLVEILDRVHTAGVVLRDLTPDNVFVEPGGRVRLIDLELAAFTGRTAPGGGTAGYCAPEQMGDGATAAAPPRPSADLYSLGAVLHLLATGTEPLLAPDDPGGRPARDRIEGRLAALAAEDTTTRSMAPLILGLMHPDPGSRRPLGLARRDLAAVRDLPDAEVPPVQGSFGPAATPGADAGRLLADGLTYLLRTMAPDGERLWPADAFPATTDPCNVYYGSAGLLGVLTRAASVRNTDRIGPGAPGGDDLRAAVREAAAWTLRRAADEPRVLPGLHFGRSGTAWALLDAGLLLDDPALIAAARETALRLPLTGPQPDIVHGTAGAGLTQVHFSLRTGDPRFAERVALCADGLLAARANGPYDFPHWTVSTGDERRPAPVVQYGFAHGTAGIGTFLVEAAEVTGDPRFLDTAVLMGEALLKAALEHDGALRWTAGPEDTVPLTHWCSGASGVGTFLLRLWRATGDAAFLRAARGAAEAVHADRWQLPPSACHGVAGNAELLLDLADATGDGLFLRRARAAVDPILADTALHGDLLLPADDTRRTVTPYHHTGVGGVVGFLLRLRHGGPRAWLPAPEAVRATGPGRPARDSPHGSAP